jgi:peptidoglycan/LPS O-acetylase OafA/YrhL
MVIWVIMVIWVAGMKQGRFGTSAPMSADARAVTPTSKPRSRLVVLDGLRLLAATMVVFYHYVGMPNADIGDLGSRRALAWGTAAANVFPYYVHKAAMYGWTGVEFFFLISGFVICMSGWGRKPADFFVSRVVRLVPAYWAATAVTVAVLIVFPRLTGGVRPAAVLANLTMVQSAYGVPNLVPAYWTLFVELTFYLLFGLVAIGGVTYRRMVTFCILWSVASIAGAKSHDAMVHLIINPPYAPYFVAGIAFFLIYKFGSNLLLWAIVAYSWLVSSNLPHANPPWEVTVLLTSFFIIMSLVATHRLDGIRWRWLTVAGALTYPLYLIHQDVGFTVITYLHGDMPATELAALTFAAMLVLAWLIHRLVERPLAPVLKRKLTDAVSRVRLANPQLASALGVPASERSASERSASERSASGASGNGASGNGASGNGASGNGASGGGSSGDPGSGRSDAVPRPAATAAHPEMPAGPAGSVPVRDPDEVPAGVGPGAGRHLS